jgi:hypothetical protein
LEIVNLINALFNYGNILFVNLKKFRFMRIFLLLLLSMFLTDTVYASGMMAAAQLSSSHGKANEHCVEKIINDTHSDHHNHDSQQKQSSSNQCYKCSHCMACATVLPPTHIVSMESQVLATNVVLIESSYQSYISAQPQRPPIS